MASGVYNGNVGVKETGVKPLNLSIATPNIGGQTIDLIRRPVPGGRTVSGLIDNAQTGCQHTGVAKGGRPISVLVVDDHRTFAEALAVAFGLEKDLDVRVASTAAEAVAAAERMQPDVVLMDVEMPGVDGIEAIRRLAETHPRARVLVLSAHDEDLLRARALEAGAVGYVSKAAPIRSLPDIVRKARRGEPIGFRLRWTLPGI